MGVRGGVRGKMWEGLDLGFDAIEAFLGPFFSFFSAYCWEFGETWMMGWRGGGFLITVFFYE